MRCFVIVVWLALTCPRDATAQVEPPVAGRPPQFSGIVGHYRIETTAAPTSVHVEEPIVLRVRIHGRGPQPYEPRRDRLRLFPADWADDFYVEAVEAEDRADRGQGTWEFVYRLRPKHERVEAIAGIKLIYYDPSRRRYQTAYPDADIPLIVTARPPARHDWDVAITAPASFDAFVPIVPAATALAPRVPGRGLLALAALAPPLASWLGYRLLRRLGSGGPVHSSPAAQRAIKELHAGTPAWVVVATYLRERLGWAAEEPTPAEATRLLKRRGLTRSTCTQARDFLCACDAARFAPQANGAAEHLRRDALALIEALEADRCLA